MMIIRLAMRNLLGAGLRTWLNVIVLSFSFVVIIWMKGLLDGWDRQAKNDMINWEYGGGQYWHPDYDPGDPFTLSDSHGKIPGELDSLVISGDVTPILITQGTLYPGGRMQSIMIKGIDPGQNLLYLPSSVLDSVYNAIPALIGSSMAESAGIKKGDFVTLRWRDKNGAFDATEIVIADIFKTNVPSVDGNQVWIPLERLREMMMMPGEATLLVASVSTAGSFTKCDWEFKTREALVEDIEKIIRAKTMGSAVMWAILLLLAMLAIFDTQVLSIFRRQKEIGTYIALGMTRHQVVTLFTLEGAMHAVLAAALGAVYGIPLLGIQSIKGLALPVDSADYGISFADRLYPEYGLGLIFSTVAIVLLTTTIVSFWPSRKIAKMRPTDALRGKIQ